jgi:hypothetical protein
LVVRYEHYFATKNIIVRRKKSYAPRKKSVRHNIVTNEFGDAQKKLQIVVLSSIPEKNTHLRGWLQKNFLYYDKKALLSDVVLLKNVGIYCR